MSIYEVLYNVHCKVSIFLSKLLRKLNQNTNCFRVNSLENPTLSWFGLLLVLFLKLTWSSSQAAYRDNLCQTHKSYPGNICRRRKDTDRIEKAKAVPWMPSAPRIIWTWFGMVWTRWSSIFSKRPFCQVALFYSSLSSKDLVWQGIESIQSSKQQWRPVASLLSLFIFLESFAHTVYYCLYTVHCTVYTVQFAGEKQQPGVISICCMF